MCRALGQASVSRGLECGGSGLKQLCTEQVPGEVREGFLEEGGWVTAGLCSFPGPLLRLHKLYILRLFLDF